MTAPPISYFGGKSRLAPAIARLLPAHRHYVEPFAGSLAVLLAKPPSVMETVSDLDGDIMCVAPETRILGADLRWVNAGSVTVGDWLIGFDEFNGPARPDSRAPSHYRRWSKTRIEAVQRITRPCYRLTFDDGTTVVSSEDHLWLGGSHKSCGRGWRWIPTKGLVCNRRVQRSWIMKLVDVWEQEESNDAGWLAGFFDGEGHLTSPGAGAAGLRVSVSQKLGPEADRCERLLKDRGFVVNEYVVRDRKPEWQPVKSLTLTGGVREGWRFLMQVRPERLIRDLTAKYLPRMSLYGQAHHAVGLVEKEYLGEQEVVAIQTTSRTYVAEGLASHNCFWRVLRDRPAEFERVCALTPHSRAEHQAAYDRDGCDDLEQARRVWVTLTQGRGGVPVRSGWRHYVQPSGGTGMPDYLTGYVARIAAAAERLKHVSLECRPALELIERYGSAPDALLYVDPPYLASSRSTPDDSRRGTQRYRHEMLGEEEHAELLVALLDCRAAVVLSGYPSALYDELLTGWHRREFAAGTGQSARGEWSVRTEVLWSNRPLGDQLSMFDDLIGGEAS